MTTPVCQSFGALQEHHATWHTRVGQRTPLFEALSISGRMPLQPAAHNDLTARRTSAAAMVFPPLYAPPLSNGVETTGLKKSLKYFLHLPRMVSHCWARNLLSLMDLAVFFGAWTPDDLPEHFAGLRPKFPLDYNLQWCWTFSPWGLRKITICNDVGLFHREGCGIWPPMYRDCNEGVRLSSFLPLFTTPSRFRQHTRAADEHTAAWNSATPPPHPSCIPGAFSVRNGLLHDLFICFWISDARKSYLKACLSYTVTISIVGQNFSCTSWE